MAKNLSSKLSSIPAIDQLVGVNGRVEAGDLLALVFQMQTERDFWRERALKDELTGIPNRRAIISHLNSALEEEKALGAPYYMHDNEEKRQAEASKAVGVAIGFIDLDGFKKLNDTYGHAAGDLALQTVGRFLRDTLRDSDAFSVYSTEEEAPEMAGRLGGDEFVIILRHTDSKHLASRQKEIESTLNMLSIDFKGKTIPLRGTLGVIDCDLNLSADENMKIADAAMYEHKQVRKAAERAANPDYAAPGPHKYIITCNVPTAQTPLLEGAFPKFN